MNILHVAHGFPPAQSGGVERYTAHVAAAQQGRGHEVSVFTRQADWRRPEYEVGEEVVRALRIFRINNTWRNCPSFEESYHHRAIAQRFGALLDRLQPDIVHLQHLVHLSTHLPDEARRRQIPVVMTFHDYWLLCNQGQLLRSDGFICAEAVQGVCTDCAGLWLGMGTPARRALHLLERWWPDIRYRTSPLRRLAHRYLRFRQRRPSQQADMLARMRSRREEMRRLGASIDVGIVPSQILREQLTAFGLPTERLRFLSHGIPVRQVAALRQEGTGVLRVAYLGRIIPAKGVHVLLEAAKRLRRADIQVDIHGDIPPYGDIDDYAKRMRQQAARISQIRWHGGYDHDALSRMLANTDVVVVPSIWYENQSLVMLEAFAARIPLVATDLGGMRELVRNGQSGLLFPRGDAQALAQCLVRLADDRQLLQRLCNGIQPVKDIETHARELESIYEQLHSRQMPEMHAVV